MTVLFLLIAILCAGIFWRRSRLGTFLSIASLAGVFIWSWTPFTTAFSGSLEWQFPVQPQRPRDAQAIVVLSAKIYPPDESQSEVLPGYGLYRRCHRAALLYKTWQAVPIVVTGGPVSTGSGTVNSTAAMLRVLVDEGVPPGAVWVEDRSLTTYDNAVHTAALLRDNKGITRIVLVTEAFHMPRAMKTFRRQGLSVE